jgi:hypothetical protein
MSKSTVKWIIALAVGATAIYLLRKTAKSVSQMIDERSVPQINPEFKLIDMAKKVPDIIPPDFVSLPTVILN